jgi:hypothetical protein
MALEYAINLKKIYRVQVALDKGWENLEQHVMRGLQMEELGLGDVGTSFEMVGLSPAGHS